jgi:hypothetical protein
VDRGLSRLAQRPALSLLVVGVLAFLIPAVLTLCGSIPQPRIQDEFSYLLAADTFVHGRLTNPTHPCWVHFESMHIIHQPSYASKYAPAQALVLALGQVVGGHPVVGVWFTVTMASVAVCWMLRGWVRPRWALLGGLLAALHPVVLSWGQSYWGGAIPLCGGALVLGALPRLLARPRVRDSLWCGLGMVFLANSRPFEGFVLSLLVLAALFTASLRRGSIKPAVLLGRGLTPAGIVLALAAGGMGYYNQRVTGHAVRMPYMVHEATYGLAPLFLWQAPRTEPPVYRHQELRDLHAGWEMSFYQDQRTLSGFLSGVGRKLAVLFQTGFPLPVLLLPLGAAPWLPRGRWLRWALWIGGLFILALLSVPWIQTHYAAPIFGLFLLVLVQCLRSLRLWRQPGRPIGLCLGRALVLLYALSALSFGLQFTRESSQGWHMDRARIQSQLTEQGGRHLVLVRYPPGHSAHEEWVYNAAEIDDAAVVWAREMQPEQNRELLTYFQDRTVWLLEPNGDAPRLVPYPPISLRAGSVTAPGSDAAGRGAARAEKQ